jgi:hypothetical protein
MVPCYSSWWIVGFVVCCAIPFPEGMLATVTWSTCLMAFVWGRLKLHPLPKHSPFHAQAPMALFYPATFGIVGQKMTTLQHRSQGDPEDPHDEHYLLATQSKQEQVRHSSAGRGDFSSPYPELTGPYFFCLFVLFCILRQGFSVSPWLSWNSLCRPGWPQTQKSSCFCLPRAGIKSVHHLAWLTGPYLIQKILL